VTHLGITPRHCPAYSPGEAIPATVWRCAIRLGSTLRHCATHSHTTGTPHPRKRTAEPSKGNGRLCLARTGHAVTLGTSPPSPSALCGHPSHCSTIPDAVGTHGDRTSPHPLLCPHTASRQQHPRISTWSDTEQATPTPPPSKPLLDGYRARHDVPPEARFARTAVY
jgi:hypothetical protein